MEENMSIEDVSTRLGVSAESVKRWCQSGKIRAEKVGRQWMIKKLDYLLFSISKKKVTVGEIMFFLAGYINNKLEAIKSEKEIEEDIFKKLVLEAQKIFVEELVVDLANMAMDTHIKKKEY